MTSEINQIKNSLIADVNRYFSTNKHVSTVFQITVYLCLAFVFHYLFRLESYNLLQSDLPDHFSIINDYINSKQYIPHPVFHMSVYYLSLITGMHIADVTPIVLTCSVILTLFVAQKLLAEKSNPLVLVIAASTIFVTAIYLPFFSISVETFSPNKWHNPTMLFLKPIALVTFYFFVRSLDLSDKKNRIYLITSSSLLLLSTATKPSFVIVFLPAVFLYVLLFRRGEYRRYPALLLFAVPSVMMLAYQYFRTYQGSDTASYFHDKIIFSFFGVMKLYSPNIIISTLLLLAFPLAVLIVSRNRIARNPYLILAWMTTLVAFLQAALLAEQKKFDQGAFGIGYVISLFLLYFFSVKESFSWFQQFNPGIPWKGKSVVIVIYLLHLVSGIYYFSILLRGGKWI